MRYAVEAGIAALLGLALFFYGDYEAGRLHALADTLATVSGVLFGFLLTAVAMLISLPERRLVANMRRTGHFGVLLKGTLRACGVHFCGLIFALIAVFADGRPLEALVSLALAAEAFAILRTAECGGRFWNVLEALERSD